MTEPFAAPPPRVRDHGPRRNAWLSGPALRLHGAAVVGVTACGVATRIELSRALDGHQIAWVYTFEWPLFAIMGLYLWWKLLMPAAPPTPPPAPNSPSARTPPGPADPGLEAWEEYLRRLHAADPPGGPS